MDQYFMDLYRTRLYLPLVFLILAYVVSPQFRRIFTKAGRWIDGCKTWQAAAGCAAVSFLLCIGVIYSGKSWGGDFSQYFAQARAIATGTIPEWYEKNIFIIDHSCVIGADVYPWMWPLMIAPFYAMYHCLPVMLLKVYESVFVAAGVALLVCFLHRRISLSKAVFLTSFISLNYVYLMDVNSVEADLISFFWGMAALNFIDLYLRERKTLQREEAASRTRAGLYAVLSGIGICCAVMTKTLCEGLLLSLAAYDLVCTGKFLISRKERNHGWQRDVSIFLLPYLSYALSMKLSNALLLPSGGSYQDYFTFSSWRFQNGIRWYFGIFQSFFGSGVRPIVSVIVCACGTLLLVLTAFGIVLKRKEELYYGFYVCGMILMLLFYDYYRSSFVLTFFPLMVLFSYYAVSWILERVRPVWIRSIVRAAALSILIMIAAQTLTAVYAVQVRDYSMDDVMNEETQETFAYIRSNLNSEDVVYFLKPRVLYYYTDVFAYYWDDDNPERLALADYVLMSVYNEQPGIQRVLDSSGNYQCVFQNSRFALYQKNHR